MQSDDPQIQRLIDQLERMDRGSGSGPPFPPLRHGGGGGTYDPMEARVTRLETHMEYVRRDLDELRAGQATIISRLNDLPTKSDLNTWRWQWLGIGLGIIALTVGGITGGLALIARFAG